MPHHHLNKNDNFGNETKTCSASNTSTDENWTTTEVNITLSASISGFISNQLSTASVLEVGSSQDLKNEHALRGKLKFFEKVGDFRSFNMTPTVIEIENEENLVYTCADKCGEEPLLPCSSSALCVVYDTCCENFSQDCPHILQDARYEFGDLITSDKFCSVDSDFIISSCPRHVQTHNETDEMQPNKTVMAEEILKDLSENVSFIRITVFESLTTSLAPAGPEETAEKKLKTAALRAPVTDASSGITYINKTVYDFHK
ncbi:hypothetical protein RRG08_019596 [Elysia crispata]|uniref:SMB domain-containing protein n=1 Tax=Elysia crispata TaxID=231223 RepID=A0AAE1AXW7_9GAST|nr:hypothetical protein RRG08_019596 [Elysia crispata]